MWTMPVFSGGNSELTAEMLDTVVEYLRRQGRVIPSPEVAVDQTPDGWLLRLASPLGMWGRLDRAASGRWGWGHMDLAPNGRFVPHPSGRFGTPQSQWAEEVNGLAPAAGAVVWLEPSGEPDGRLYFAAPRTSSRDTSAFWAEITEADAGEYGYRELQLERGRFAPDAAGRTARAGGDGTAVEAGGATGVPVGAVVLMFEFESGERVAFRYGAASTRWGKLSGRTTNTVYTVTLDAAEAGAGTWTATVADADSGQSFAAVLPGDATAATVQELLNDALNELTPPATAEGVNLVRVAGGVGSTGAGGPYRIEFLERLGGDRAVTLTVGGTAAPVAVVVQEGRDDPYTDGTGAYGWYEVEFDADDIARPVPGGLSSDWPYGAAYEAGGETNVPAGSVVRIYPGPSVALAGRDAPDARYLFRHAGDVGRWAVIGTAARWVVDLGDPTAGLWVLRWDDGGKNPLAVRRNTAHTLAALATHTAATIGWTQAVPTRVFSAGAWATQSVVTAGPTVPLPATAAAIRAALEARYPMLVGNVTVTGGPLGSTVTTINTTDPCNPVSTTTGVPVTIELTGDLAECGNTAAFASSLTGTGFAGTPTSVVGAGSRVLLSYEALLGSLPPASITTLDHGLACARPVAPVVPSGDEAFFGSLYARRGPFTLDAAGYDGDADLPEVSVVSFLAYGEDGTEPGAVTVSAAEAVPAGADDEPGAAAARPGRGVYYATLIERGPYSNSVPFEQLLAPAVRDGRLVVVAAVEAGGRDDVLPKSVVRLWTTGRADYAGGATEAVPERWAFQGPTTGFWAAVGANLGGGEYEVAPTLTQWSRLRYVAAEESNGNVSVPVGTAVWVEPALGVNRFVMETFPFDTVALVVYGGPAGVYSDQPAATGYIAPTSSPATRCVVETGGEPLVAGGVYPGLHTGSVPAAGGGTLPVYTVESPLRRASSGRSGAVTNVSQVLGGGDKVALGGGVSWGSTPLAGAAAGETVPAGGKWLCASTATSQFCGSVAASGARWGFRATGAGLGQVVRGGGAGSGGTLVGGIGTGDLTVRVTVPTAGSPLERVVPTIPFDMAIGTGASAYEVLRVTRACNVPATSDQCDFTVARAQYGTTALAASAGYTWVSVTVYPADTIFGPARVSFWTDQAAFAHNGVAGGAGSVTIPGVHSSLDFALTFAGGLQTAISAGSGNVNFGPSVGVAHGPLADGPGVGIDNSGATYFGVSAQNGLIAAVTTIP